MAHARTFQARIRGQIHGQETNNILHFGGDQAPMSDADLQLVLIALATAIMQCIITTLLPAASSDWSVNAVEVKQLHPLLTDPQEHAAPAGSNGENSAANTSFESVLMRIRTGGGGKRGRGRVFLPPVGDAAVTNSNIDDATTNNQLAAFIACLAGKFMGATATEPFVLGVLSRKTLADTNNDFGQAFRDATTLAIEQNVTCLRSRKVGSGS